MKAVTMSEKTVHVTRSKDGKWEVRGSGNAVRSFSSQKEAVDAAIKTPKKDKIVIRTSSALKNATSLKGSLPQIQAPPIKSSLGSKNIRQAVAATFRQRLNSSE